VDTASVGHPASLVVFGVPPRPARLRALLDARSPVHPLTSEGPPLPTRRLLSVLCTLALALALGLATAVAAPGVARETLELSASNPAVGALRLTAAAPQATPYDGVMVFEVEGHDPVTVRLGRWAVVGSPKFDQDDYWKVQVNSNAAMVDIPGLDPTGTYRATATYVPSQGGAADGDAAEVTTTLSVTRTPFLFTAGKYQGWPSFDLGVLAYPPGKVIGRIDIVDITTGIKMVRQATARARVGDGFEISAAKPRRGIHQFRATFTPKPALKGVLDKAVVTSPEIRFPG
jgi:hypothetical protein